MALVTTAAARFCSASIFKSSLVQGLKERVNFDSSAITLPAYTSTSNQQMECKACLNIGDGRLLDRLDYRQPGGGLC